MTALDNIKAALEAGPTNGPWFAASNGQYKIATITKVTGIFADQMPNESAIRADAAFIATCNPTAIRELLAYVESLEKDAGRYRWLRSGGIDDVYVWDQRGEKYQECGSRISDKALDDAIDATMEQTK